MRTLRLAGVLLVTLLVPAAMTACGDDDDDPTGPGSVTGTYTLRTVNGQPLPFVEEEEGLRFSVVSGSITLSANGVCSTSFRFTVTDLESGQVIDDETETDTCTYTVSGSTLTVTFGPGDVETATISGGTITVNDDGFVLVFRK